MDRSWEYINRSQTHKCGIGAEATQFAEEKYINGINVAVQYSLYGNSNLEMSSTARLLSLSSTV